MKPLSGIVDLRELVEGNVAGPFVIVGIARHRHFAVALFAHWDARRHDVANIAVHVGVHHILRRGPTLVSSSRETRPSFAPCRASCSYCTMRRARARSSALRSFIAVFLHHGPVARHDSRRCSSGSPFT